MDGVLLIDKPAGPTSADIIRKLKRLVRPSKIGHAGTLDPDATGLLVILIGKATRFQSFFLESNKVYEGIIRLGIATDTDDISGNTLATKPPPDLATLQSLLDSTCQHFTGKVQQTPPKFSAVKIEGKRAYELARQGKEFQTTARTVTIEELKISLLDETRLGYRVTCSSGTYVRSLARDIGEFLGTLGCAETIRRTASGNFLVRDAFALNHCPNSQDELSDSLLPLSALVANCPQFILGADDCLLLQRGNQSPLAGIPTAIHTGLASVANPQGELVAMLKVKDDGPSIGRWEIAFVI